MSIATLFFLLMVVACGLALFRGDRSAKMVAAAVACGSVLTMLEVSGRSESWQGSEPYVLAIDATMLVIFGAVMLKSDSFWPIWTTSAQLLTVIAHLGPIVRKTYTAIPFAVAEQIWGWFILTQLILVTLWRPAWARR